MFSNVSGDVTVPNTNGSVVTSRNYASGLAMDSNSVDASGMFTYATVRGSDFGYQTAAPTYFISYNIQEKHKTYKILSSIMSEYKKNKTMYDINIYGGDNNIYMIPNGSIIIKMNTNLGIVFFNNKENKTENIERISDCSSDVLQDCVVKFLDKHSEEFMDFIVDSVKKDVISCAKKESEKIKDQLEFVEMIKDMEE